MTFFLFYGGAITFVRYCTYQLIKLQKNAQAEQQSFFLYFMVASQNTN